MGTQREQDDDTKGIWNGGRSPVRRRPGVEELQVHISVITEEMENLRSENRFLREKALEYRLRAEKAEVRLVREGITPGEKNEQVFQRRSFAELNKSVNLE
ncbi:unnamed protein product [Microthlaspi erraticum]|uniref:Uncharacterized protein n=1 Tax=Microthlaspi erraticum TaxID=1685480 RepID=A0A6D2IH60_9BRAS|nr:unnamed protein product [Microthlaspi erraticum]